MLYKWLLFDADGTLFDYDTAEKLALQNTFEEVDLAFSRSYLAAYQKINSQIWQDFEQGKITQQSLRIKRFDLLFETLGLGYNAHDFSLRYLRHLSQRAELITGAKEVVTALAKKFKLAIITNGLTDVQRPRFAASALQEYFNITIISEEAGVAKPDTRIFDVAFAKMGKPNKTEVLIIGDSLTSDIQGGVNYGIDTCWFNAGSQRQTPRPKPTFEIALLAELLEILIENQAGANHIGMEL